MMTRLENVLLVNAISSGATGLLLILFPGFIAGIFGVSQTLPFTGVGIFLVLFALWVFSHSRKVPRQPKGVRWIIIIDITWVIGSLVIIFPQLFGLSSTGYLLIGAVAIWVALMAFLQSKGLSTSSPG